LNLQELFVGSTTSYDSFTLLAGARVLVENNTVYPLPSFEGYFIQFFSRLTE
jgi:hypothetical protein